MRISKLLSFVRLTRNDAKVSDVKIDTGGGHIVTAINFSTAGDDSHPLATDYPIVGDLEQSGGTAVVGYIDPLNEPKTQEGEKRIYARDPSDGTVKVEFWLKNDGAAVLSNVNGLVELKANGDVDINGVIISANGDVTIPSSLTVNGKEIAGHNHSQGNDSGGDTQVDTGPNN